ncbi:MULTISPECIES: TRAP transporter large permease [Rhodobacterales]|uniref:TRAP transporter large permease protein n=3 Tax=Rhodobacterales TaxID=204455 RepID=A0A0P1IV23_9RHOB|nr:MULTISPECIES: TRAP transporter large permease subunit [Rhodobacterales]CUH58750.1 Neu5Ac permease [Thalassobacter stenotrophicus]CUI93918.1 Neu5Ac permease [Cognatishimia activa]CUK25809.1 Neu5Ac permease [Cognatishimia activa]SHJ38913.1 TRAP transporter, DctM subunit [Thalassobacter stenotrophicus DSM 16310]
MEFLIEVLPALMFGSLVLGLFSGLPVAVVLGGITVVFSIIAISLGEMRLVQISLLPNRIFGGSIENQVLIAAPLFIFMGVVLEKSRIAEDLLLTLQKLLRGVPGGLALAVTAMGTILAAATGIIGASVVMLTVMALPTMLKRGYSAELASGAVVSAGTLGILIPPSVMLVFMGDILTINLAKLFIAALVPGLVLAVVYMIYIVITATMNPSKAPPLPPLTNAERKGLWREASLSFALPFVLITAVLGSILGGIATPTEAAAVGAFGALLLGCIRKRVSLAMLGEAMDGSVRTLAMLFFIFITATGFAYVFRIIGGEHFIVETARSLDMGDWGILAMLMLMIFALGFFFDWIEITLIMLPIVAPIVGLMDLGDHVAKEDLIYWFAVLMAVNLQTSFLTPPFGFALFFLKGAAGDLVTIKQIYRGIIPFVLLQIIVLALITWQPWLVLWLPNAVL